MKWVTMWGNAQSKVLPAPATYAKDITLRYPIYVPFNGNKIKVELDNFCSDNDVDIDYITVGIANKLSDKCTILGNLLFNGNKSFTLKAHQTIKSDEFDIKLNENDYLVLSIYSSSYIDLTSGVDITGPLSKGYFAYGDQSKRNMLDINTSKSTSWVYFLSNVDIYTDDNNEAIICYGDSITSQDWPDYFMLALKENNINNVSVIRKAVSGTRILREYDCITYQSYGRSGFNRFIREISSVSGAKKVIIQHGINDIIHPVGTEINIFRPMSDMPTVEDLISGLEYYYDNAKKLDLEIYPATLLPIYNWRTYNQDKEDVKNGINEYIRNKANLIDFENQIGTFKNSYYEFNDGCDSSDHLHPSKKAYKIMGDYACSICYKQK